MTTAIQDAIPGNHCWGCGALNAQGLQIKSYWRDDGAVCTFRPAPHHAAGPPHVLNGGIIAALIDCHSICTAFADSYRAAGLPLGADPLLWNVTAKLAIEYLAPAPIAEPVELHARVVEVEGCRRRVACVLRSGGVERARAEVLAVQVPPAWLAG